MVPPSQHATSLLCRSLLLAVSITLLPVFAQSPARNEWPCFHGLDRSNKSPETGLLKKWPESGPKLLWTASGLGDGYSSVSVAAGRVYVAGNVEKTGHVFALDLNGTFNNGLGGSNFREPRNTPRIAGDEGADSMQRIQILPLPER